MTEITPVTDALQHVLDLISQLRDRVQEADFLALFEKLDDEQLALVIQHRLFVQKGAVDVAVQFLLHKRPDESDNNTYIARLRRFFARHTRDLSAADDLVQLVSLKLSTMRTYTGQTPFDHYLIGIARKTLADWVAAGTRTVASRLQADHPAPCLDCVDDEASGKQLSRVLEAITCLPSEQLCQLLRGYFRGDADDVLAQRFGMKKTDIQKKRCAALERIQRQIMREDWMQDHKDNLEGELSSLQGAVIDARLKGRTYEDIAKQQSLKKCDVWEALYSAVGNLMQSWLHSHQRALERFRDSLSNQQYEACQWLLQGVKKKEIAGQLKVHQLTASKLCDEAIIVISELASDTQ